MLILTVAQRHTDHNATGQQLSRHSLRTLLYFLFSPPHIFFNSIYPAAHFTHLLLPANAQTQCKGKIKRVQFPNTQLHLSNIII